MGDRTGTPDVVGLLFSFSFLFLLFTLSLACLLTGYPASLHSLQSHVRALDQIRIDRVSLQRAFALESQEDMRSQTKKHNAKEGTREPQKTTQQHNNSLQECAAQRNGPRTANRQQFEAEWQNTFNSGGNISVWVQFHVRNTCNLTVLCHSRLV